MNAREERGLVLAATAKLVQRGKVWLVPSATGNGKKYTVCPDDDCPFCSCPDFEDTGLPCKHVYATRFTMKREQAKDGTVTETRTITLTQRKTYPQDWPIYNLAQTEEKKRFLVLLHDLCRGLPNPPQPKSGRRRTDMSDMVFTAVYKVYSTFSGRRFCTDLAESFEKGYLARKVNGMMCWQFLESELLTPVLKALVTTTAKPLAVVETTFAPDSTGFSTSRFVRWFDEKYGRERSGRAWVKAHAIFGVKTHVCTAVEILDQDAADCPQFRPLVEATAKAGFNVQEVPADKAYLSDANLEQVEALGGTAYIPFKVNSQPDLQGPIWERMFHYYSLRREEFEKHYHQRSNGETGFSMVKAKFRDNVRSKSEVAMRNEVYCKFIAHNICCLIMSQLELGIEPVFWGETAKPETAPGAPAPAISHQAATPPLPGQAAIDAPLAAELPVRRPFTFMGA